MRARRYTGLVGLLLILALVTAACGAGAAGGAPATSSLPTTVALVHATPTPTDTPMPTPSVVPTPTMAPTPTATPGMTTDQRIFLADLDDRYQMVTASITDFYAQIKKAAADPSLNTSPAWIKQTADDLGVWSGAYMSSRDLDVPPGMELIYADWMTGAKTLDRASSDFATAIDNQDAALLKTASEELLDGSTAIGKYVDDVKAFKAQFPGS